YDPVKVGGGLTIAVSSTIPVGAGLGSSAGFAVSMSAALLLANGHVKLPEVGGSRGGDAEGVNKWALEAEDGVDGNPSGIDNAVSTFGIVTLPFFLFFFVTLSPSPLLTFPQQVAPSCSPNPPTSRRSRTFPPSGSSSPTPACRGPPRSSWQGWGTAGR